MIEIRHRSRNHSMRGHNVMPLHADVATDPEMQETIRRLGENLSSVNSRDIDRIAVVLGVASVVRDARRTT